MSKERELRFKSMREYRKLCEMLSLEGINQLTAYEKANEKHNEYVRNMGGD